MVVLFVAFVGAYHVPGSLNPWAAAVLAALLVTWVTFVPCSVSWDCYRAEKAGV